MSKRTKEPQPGDVKSLNAGFAQANPQRVAALKQWHIDQAISETKPVAIINFTLTAEGEINSKAICLEPEHAKVMLPALEEAAQQLRDQVGGEPAPKRYGESTLHSLLYRTGAQHHCYYCHTCNGEFPTEKLHIQNYRQPDSSLPVRTLICEQCLAVADYAADLRSGLRLL